MKREHKKLVRDTIVKHVSRDELIEFAEYEMDIILENEIDDRTAYKTVVFRFLRIVLKNLNDEEEKEQEFIEQLIGAFPRKTGLGVLLTIHKPDIIDAEVQEGNDSNFFPQGLFFNTLPLVNQDKIKFAMNGMNQALGNGPSPILIQGDRFTGKSYSFHYLRHLATQSKSNLMKLDMRELRLSDPDNKPYDFVKQIFSKIGLTPPHKNSSEQSARAASVYSDDFSDKISTLDKPVTLFVDHFEPEERPSGSLDLLVGIMRRIRDGEITNLNLVITGLKKSELESDIRGYIDEWPSEQLNQDHLVSYFGKCFDHANVEIDDLTIEKICGVIFTNLPNDPLEKMEAIKSRFLKKYQAIVSNLVS